MKNLNLKQYQTLQKGRKLVKNIENALNKLIAKKNANRKKAA